MQRLKGGEGGGLKTLVLIRKQQNLRCHWGQNRVSVCNIPRPVLPTLGEEREGKREGGGGRITCGANTGLRMNRDPVATLQRIIIMIMMKMMMSKLALQSLP